MSNLVFLKVMLIPAPDFNRPDNITGMQDNYTLNLVTVSGLFVTQGINLASPWYRTRLRALQLRNQGSIDMSGKRCPEKFKIEAVKQVTDRGYKVGEVARRLGVTPKGMHEWIKRYGDNGGQHQAITPHFN